MAKQENEYGVKLIVMRPAFKVVCPLTQAPISLKCEVDFMPGDFVPEYMEVQNALRQKLDNKKFTIEGAAREILDYFDSDDYQPEHVRVVVKTENNNTYFPVEVFIESPKKEPGDEKSAEKADKKARKKPSEKTDPGNPGNPDNQEKIDN